MNIFHSDIEDFLATKKINADDDIRLKTLSIGVSIPDLFLEKAKNDEDYYVFYPHTVFKEYGVPFADISAEMSKWYDKLVQNPNVRKRKLNARKILQTIASLQGEAGYPFVFFSDNVNKQRTNSGLIKFSNLCTEIIQPTEQTFYKDYHEANLDEVGLGVSCNLASGNVVNMMEHNAIESTVYAAMDIMTSVSDKSELKFAKEIYRANRTRRSVGFGIMNLAGFFAKNYITYGSDASIDFANVFMNSVNYYSLKYSMEKAKETGKVYAGFENSTYASGKYFEKHGEELPRTPKVKELFEEIYIPSQADWDKLKEDIMEHGLYHSERLAIAPTGSISYVLSATASATPIKQLVEERTYGNSKTYYPMPYADEYGFMYETAYDMDSKRIIDVIAALQRHVDQGISLEMCEVSDGTTRDLIKNILYAHHVGLKTLYYTRTKKLSINECVSCAV